MFKYIAFLKSQPDINGKTNCSFLGGSRSLVTARADSHALNVKRGNFKVKVGCPADV